jgi:hypothetical protein
MSVHQAVDLEQFYELLDLLEQKLGGARKLSDCNGRMNWPQRGVYFFREAGERRKHTGRGPRIVRVGTHALKTGSKTKLWTRLSQHRGQLGTGGGNHRGSIFRGIVGTALIARDRRRCPTWGEGSSAPGETRLKEQRLERAVSTVIRDMPFLWLAIDDDPGHDSLRGYIERNAIALLSNFDRKALDPPSRNWLGHFCDRERVRKSGLWNQNHVDETHDPAFLGVLEELIEEMAGPA